MLPNDLQIVLIIGVILYFIVIIRMLHSEVLILKYTMLWLVAGVILLLLACFPRIMTYFIEMIGIKTPSNGLFAVCIAFIILILMSITSIVSKQNEKIRTLVQYTAFLEKEIRDIKDSTNNEKDK